MRLGARAALALLYGGLALLPFAWLLTRAGRGTSTTESSLDVLLRTSVQELFANSILLALVTTLIATALGLPLALLIQLRRFPGREAIRLLYFLPLVIPPHIHAIAWMRVLGDQGWLTSWLQGTFGYQLRVRAPFGDAAGDALLGHLYLGPAWIMACATFPLVTLSVSAGMRSIDGDLLSAARLLGGRRAALREVLFPLLGPRVIAGAFFVFVLALSTFPVVSLLDTPVLIQKVFFTFTQIDQSSGAILAVPLVLVALVAVVTLAFAERRAGLPAPAGRPVEREAAGLGSTLLALLPLVLAGGIPLASLLVEAGPLRFGGTTPDNYQTVFARVAPAFGDSLVLTALGVLALLLVSYPVGRLVARAPGSALEMVGLSTLALPPVVVGVALVLFWSAAATGGIGAGFLAPVLVVLALAAAGRGGSLRHRAGRALAVFGIVAAATALAAAVELPSAVYGEGIALVVLAYLARFLPFTIRFVRNGFLGVDPDEGAAARLAGHGAVSRFLSIELPRMGRVVAGAAVMAYVLCFTELAATLMVVPPRWQSVQARIFNMVHYRSIGEVAALCIMVVGLAALPVVIAGVVGRRRWEVL